MADIGWRVPLVAPPGIAIGSLKGHADGYLGDFPTHSNASTSVRATLSSKVHTSGLIEQLPRGFADASPISPDEWDATEARSPFEPPTPTNALCNDAFPMGPW